MSIPQISNKPLGVKNVATTIERKVVLAREVNSIYFP